MVPYDNQRCVDALGTSLEKRVVALPRPNSTCDTVICFCGIRLHQIGSLRCPAAFAVVGAAAKNATPTAVVKDLEKSCRYASYAGCSRCVQSLQKSAQEFGGSEGTTTGRRSRGGGGGGDVECGAPPRVVAVRIGVRATASGGGNYVGGRWQVHTLDPDNGFEFFYPSSWVGDQTLLPALAAV